MIVYVSLLYIFSIQKVRVSLFLQWTPVANGEGQKLKGCCGANNGGQIQCTSTRILYSTHLADQPT